MQFMHPKLSQNIGVPPNTDQENGSLCWRNDENDEFGTAQRSGAKMGVNKAELEV